MSESDSGFRTTFEGLYWGIQGLINAWIEYRVTKYIEKPIIVNIQLPLITTKILTQVALEVSLHDVVASDRRWSENQTLSPTS